MAMGPKGRWSLGSPLPGAAPEQLRLSPSSNNLGISAGAGRLPVRRGSKSLPNSPGLHGVQELGDSSGDLALEAQLQELLLEQRRRQLARFRSSSPLHSRPSSPAHSRPAPPAHSRSNSTPRFTGRVEIPAESTAHVLIARIVELERAYAELIRAYESLQAENEHYRMLAMPGAGVSRPTSRNGSISPRNYSPSSSRPPSPAPGVNPEYNGGERISRVDTSSQGVWAPQRISPTSTSALPPPRPSTTVPGSISRIPSRSALQQAMGTPRPRSSLGRYH
ncbi:hypothetical protein JCM21900_002034 [Sporobolomyces salmonicolor]